MAEGIKKTINIPVMVAKRIDEDMVEKIVAGGQADFVCIGRPYITDPDYGNKLLEGRADRRGISVGCRVPFKDGGGTSLFIL